MLPFVTPIVSTATVPFPFPFHSHAHILSRYPFYVCSAALLISNDVLEHELALLKSQNPDKIDENDLVIREAELNMKLNLLVRFCWCLVGIRVKTDDRCVALPLYRLLVPQDPAKTMRLTRRMTNNT